MWNSWKYARPAESILPDLAFRSPIFEQSKQDDIIVFAKYHFLNSKEQKAEHRILIPQLWLNCASPFSISEVVEIRSVIVCRCIYVNMQIWKYAKTIGKFQKLFVWFSQLSLFWLLLCFQHDETYPVWIWKLMILEDNNHGNWKDAHQEMIEIRWANVFSASASNPNVKKTW